MLELQFKSVFRLNRVLILYFIGFSLLGSWHHQGWWGMPALVGLCAVHGVVLLVNEFFMKMAKRFREAELGTIRHFSMFLPVALGVYASLNYLLTGNLIVFLLGFFSVLESHFMGQNRLSGILSFGLAGVFLLGFAFGYPHTLPKDPVYLFSSMLALGSCLYYYGTMVSKLVMSHTTQVDKLQSIAATDVLTGLTNRRQFNIRLHEEISRARRHETPLSLVLFDLDDFKRLNDFYGHPVGDRILKELGKLIRQSIRESDLPARYGGEEFAIILPETREAEAYDLMDRIRLIVAQTVFCLPENPLTVTISIGVAQLEPRQHTAFELVELTDKALYEAKTQGKNRVVKGSSLGPKVLLSKNAIIQNLMNQGKA